MLEELDGLVSVFNDGSIHLSVCLVIHNYKTVESLFQLVRVLAKGLISATVLLKSITAVSLQCHNAAIIEIGHHSLDRMLPQAHHQ